MPLPTLYIAPLRVFMKHLQTMVGRGTSVSITGGSKPPTIDELRAVMQRSAWQPYGQDREVVVICQVDRMHQAAATSLLKFTEEPPPWVELILQATTEVVLPTIRSRVEVRRLSDLRAPVSLKELMALSFSERLNWVEGLGVEPTALLQGWLEELSSGFSAEERLQLSRQLMQLLPLLAGGANKKLVLEYLMVSLPRTNEQLKSKSENSF